jgi:hypothetical protein
VECLTAATMNGRGNREGGEALEQPGRTYIGLVLHYDRPLVVEATWGMGNGGANDRRRKKEIEVSGVFFTGKI